MRLIDADALEKQMRRTSPPIANLPMLRAIPTVDAVEVVRCKDCKWYKHYEDYNFCDNYTSLMDNVSDETFCCYGERRDDD